MTVRAHMFWANGRLGRFERLAANSFVKNGYDLTLWSYEPLGDVPANVKTADANAVIPEHQMFMVKGSLAPFADLFRLRLLSTEGGLWADADAIAVKPADKLPNVPFLVTEDIWDGSWRKDKPYTITNCIINNPNPQSGDIIDLAYFMALRFPKDKIDWTTIGPNLLHNLEDIYPNHGYEIMPPEFANYFEAGDIVEKLMSPNQIPEGAHFIHLYNDIWRRSGLNKNTMDVPEDSLLGKLIQTYGEY